MVPYNEYLELLALAEDAQDAADASAAMKELAIGEDETVPGDIAERLITGKEHPVKIWREYRGLTQEALGKAAGVGKSYISQIENTGKTASTKVLKALAEALDVGMDDLA